jgi:hypothetical protein
MAAANRPDDIVLAFLKMLWPLPAPAPLLGSLAVVKQESNRLCEMDVHGLRHS